MSATGSGKTITAAACALESFADGRILVTVPTLDLLVQTAQAWRAVGHRAPMIAVCSLENDPVLGELGVRTTTNPIQLALWAGSGPVVVFATYASLVDREDPEDPTGQRKVRGPLEAALAGGEQLYGQHMDGFDLAIADEAHGTAGDLGRPWAAIHDNARIPADFRLYLTATPRILAAPRPHKGSGGQEAELATMADDPNGTYGAWIAELGLSEAIERKILAGFEIDVLEIHDPSPVLGETEEARRGRRLALLQTALLEHAAAYNLRTVMTFHQKVEEAAAFAEKLPETAAALYINDATDADLAAADTLPKSSIDAEFYELEADRHLPPGPGLGGVAVRRPHRRRAARGDPAVRQRHRCRRPPGPPRLPRLRTRARRRRRHHRRTRRRSDLLRRHPRLPGRDHAEHRPRTPTQPQRQHQGGPDHRAGVSGARREPDRHGRLRQLPPPRSRAPGPALPRRAPGRTARLPRPDPQQAPAQSARQA